MLLGAIHGGERSGNHEEGRGVEMVKGAVGAGSLNSSLRRNDLKE